MSGKKYTILDMQTFAATKNGQCLSEAYTKSQTKMLWECSKGHQFISCWNNVQKGRWCSVCSDLGRPFRKLKGIAYLQQLAAEHGGECLSTVSLGQKIKHTWKCAEGHIWDAVPSAIKSQGCWCPTCGEEIRRANRRTHTMLDMDALAAKRGGACLSIAFVSMDKGLRWQCRELHQWDAQPSHIQQGKWCAICGEEKRRKSRIRHTIASLSAFAEQKDGRCLSTQYEGNGQKILWECASGHQWTAKLGNIFSGKWCPECTDWRGEKLCRAFFEQLFGVPFNKVRPSWLISSKGIKMELDGFSQELKIAFEHQGRQHYEYIEFFHEEEQYFIQQQARDKRKRDLCAENGILLIEIPSIFEMLGTEKLKSFIRTQLVKNNRKVPKTFDQKIVNASSVYNEMGQLWLKF